MTVSFRTVATRALGGAVAIGERPAVDAQTIVWLHGLGGGAITFEEIIDHPALRATTALLVDLPGHGLSDGPATWPYSIELMANVAAEVIVSLTCDPVVVMGHSMGGSVAISLTHRYPHLVRSLVVAEPNLDPGIGTISAHIARQTEERFATHGYRALVRAVRGDRTGTHATSRWPDTLAEASPIALHRAATSLLANRDPTFRQTLESLTVPTTFIAGDQTRPIETGLAHTNVDMVVIPDAGHEMWVDNPDAFATCIAAIAGKSGKGCRP